MEKKVVRHDLSDAQYKTILFEQDKESPFVWYLTLNRPDKNNAISIGPDYQIYLDLKNQKKRSACTKT